MCYAVLSSHFSWRGHGLQDQGLACTQMCGVCDHHFLVHISHPMVPASVHPSTAAYSFFFVVVLCVFKPSCLLEGQSDRERGRMRGGGDGQYFCRWFTPQVSTQPGWTRQKPEPRTQSGRDPNTWANTCSSERAVKQEAVIRNGAGPQSGHSDTGWAPRTPPWEQL